MKAIYTIVNGCIHKINQDTSVPTNIVKMPYTPYTHTSSKLDEGSRTVGANIWINTLDSIENVKSNGELYEEMIMYMKEQMVNHYDQLSNSFTMYLDYSVCDSMGKELDHSVMIRNVSPIDAIYPLGVNSDNECVYRRVKVFKPHIEFALKTNLPFGIMSTGRSYYRIHINEIMIFQNYGTDDANCCCGSHNSLESNSYTYGSHTIASSLNNKAQVYSSDKEGLVIAPIEVNFMPRRAVIDFEIILSNYVVAFDSLTIDKVIEENINAGAGENPDHKPDNPGTKPDNPGTKPDPKPDEPEWYFYYERCNQTTPDALMVVSDTYPEDSFDSKLMVHISDVIKDIPDIVEGEYVLYVSGLITTI